MARSDFVKLPGGEGALRKFARNKAHALNPLSEEASLALFSDSSLLGGDGGFSSDNNYAALDLGMDATIGEERTVDVIGSETFIQEEPRRSKRVKAKHSFPYLSFLCFYLCL